jgi:REP element-mobilizing transposase RayT
MNRGVAKRPLFEDRQDARFFLARLAGQVRLGRIEVHVFCLMNTHFHLLVRSPIGALSEAMRRVQNAHSRQFNRRRERDGTLIRGRYMSKPVHSLSYRRTLVSYIDANPVKAGIVATSGAYGLGSAKTYVGATGSGPPWLSREWVESEATRLAGTDRYSGAAYVQAFGGLSREAAELVHARLASTAVEDPLDDLIGTAPDRVRAWMQRKARLADGCRIGLPVCGRRSLEAALAEHVRTKGPWMVEDGRSTRRGADLARTGLSRDLCGLTWHAIASAERATDSVVRGRAGHHRRLLETDLDYAGRAAEVAKAAMDRCAGTGPVRAE